MKIVVPVSSYEFKEALMILGFLKTFKRFGDYDNHELLVVSRPDDKRHAKAIFDELKDLFDKKTLHIFSENGTTGWPQGPNFYWQQTIQYFKDTDNKDPWFWMEMDMTPLQPKWADLLEQEYKRSNFECLGTVQDSTTITTDHVRIIIAKHLQGTAIYPPRIDKICSIWEYVDKLNTAFDVITQWEIMPHTGDTKLIQQGFRTVKYKLSFDPMELRGEDNGDLNGVVTYDDPINPLAVIHHGCKDATLADIVLSEEYDRFLQEFYTNQASANFAI